MHRPAQAVLNKANLFLTHYATPEMQNYGHWVYVIFIALKKLIRILLPDKNFEDFINLNTELNNFFFVNKVTLSSSPLIIATEDQHNNYSRVKNILTDLGFFSLIQKFEDLLLIPENFCHLLVAYAMRPINYRYYALWADLQLIDVAASYANRTENLNIQKIGEQAIYASRGPFIFNHGTNFFDPAQQVKQRFNIKFWLHVLANNVTDIIALGQNGIEFPDYRNSILYSDIDESGARFNIFITSENISNSAEVSTNIQSAYSKFELTIVCETLRDLEKFSITKKVTIHNIQIEDGATINFEQQNLLSLVTQLKITLKKSAAVLVHCQAGFGRTGYFIALFLLLVSNKLEALFASDNFSENLTQYKNFIAHLRTFRDRVLATAEQVSMALVQCIYLLEQIPEPFAGDPALLNLVGLFGKTLPAEEYRYSVADKLPSPSRS